MQHIYIDPTIINHYHQKYTTEVKFNDLQKLLTLRKCHTRSQRKAEPISSINHQGTHPRFEKATRVSSINHQGIHPRFEKATRVSSI
jgi:hypothetical protein